jgi:flagellar M-ring protein FliF
VKDNVSVGQNLPDAKGNQGGTKSQSNRTRTDETTNYEISKTVQNQVKETGTVKKLSVAVLVDGVYGPDANGDVVYKPRSAEDLANIKKLVESSVGFDSARGDKVEVINMQFAGSEQEIIADSPFSWLKDDLDSIIQTLVLGGITILVILLIVRPLVTRAIASSQAAQDEDEYEQSLLSGPNIMGELPDFSGGDDEEDELISISRIKGGVKSSTFRKINDMIGGHPNEALQVMRRWAFEPTD